MTTEAAPRLRLTDLLGAFAAAGELGGGQPVGYLARVCWLSLGIGRALHLPDETLTSVYYTSLLAHAGCTAGAAEFAAFLMSDELAAQHEVCLCDPDNKREVLRWLGRHVAPDRAAPVRAGFFARALLNAERTLGGVEAGCSDVAGRIAARLGMGDVVRESMFSICESWNGKGPRRLSGDAIPVAARIVHAAMMMEVLVTELGVVEGTEAARKRAGKSLDPAAVEAFAGLTGSPSFSEDLDREGVWEWVLAAEPRRHYISEAQVDDAALAFADFSDLKAAGFAAHSRAAATLGEGIARRLRLNAAEVTLVRRAALVHAAGHAGVPALLLGQTRPLPLADEERMRMHPLLTERITERTPPLADAGRIAAMHHERLDGGGYPRRLAGAAIPMPARVVAIADAFRELVESPRDIVVEPAQALLALKPDVGGRFDPDCFAALEAEIEGREITAGARQSWPAELSDREVEVLRLLGRGLKTREIAGALVVAESTARHHVEHIYAKIGVSSRAGAVLFAIENELLL